MRRYTGWGGHRPEIELKAPQPFAGLIGLKRRERGMKYSDIANEAIKNALTIHARVVGSINDLTKDGIRPLSDKDLIQRHNSLGKISQRFVGEFTLLSRLSANF